MSEIIAIFEAVRALIFLSALCDLTASLILEKIGYD